jgi:hypothetical protein
MVERPLNIPYTTRSRPTLRKSPPIGSRTSTGMAQLLHNFAVYQKITLRTMVAVRTTTASVAGRAYHESRASLAPTRGVSE